jgi:hypothetical protein
MGDRVEALLRHFQQAHEELVAVAAGCPPGRWRAHCAAEDGWPVGVVVHHVAEDYADVRAVIEALAAGGPVPVMTRVGLERRNAQHARRAAGCAQEETVALLRRNGAALTETIRRLDDERLARAGRVLGRETSVARMVEPVLLDHIRTHLASIRAAIGARFDPG